MRCAPAGSTFRPWIPGASSDTPSTFSSSCCSSSPRSPSSEGHPKARRCVVYGLPALWSSLCCSAPLGERLGARRPRLAALESRLAQERPSRPRSCHPSSSRSGSQERSRTGRARRSSASRAQPSACILADNPGPLRIADVGFLAVFTGAPTSPVWRCARARSAPPTSSGGRPISSASATSASARRLPRSAHG